MIQNFSRYQCFPSVGKIWDKKKKEFVKEYYTKDGYIIVNLCNDEGKWRTMIYHRAILQAYRGSSIPRGFQVNHINEIKTDNRIKNLNLMTCKENNNWGTHIERVAKANTNHPNMSKRVQAYDKQGNLVFDFPSAMEAERQGFNQGHISSCCNGKRKSHKGYIWRYAN